MITVRDSKPEDVEAVRQIEASATTSLRQTYRPNQKALRNRHTISRALCRLVAEEDGVIAGTTQYFADGNTMRIIGLGVHADFRRRGIARALISALAARAREQGFPCVATRTVEETGNVPIFEALGFQVESRCPDEYSESVTGRELTDVSLRMKL